MSRRTLSILAAVLVAGAAGAETTRTLRAELTPERGTPFTVENLAGEMAVLPGDGPTVTVVATVHAEDARTADAVTLDEVRGKHGFPTLRLAYPFDTVRYRDAGNSRVEYGGRTVRVSSRRGVEVWATVEVRVPRSEFEGTFRNVVGSLRAEGVAGTITLDTASGDIEARRVSGDVTADTGSGDVRAEDVHGEFSCDTGSGHCIIAGFDGDELECDTGSGDVRVENVTARRVTADTGSGDVRVNGADIERFTGDTGSGRIALEVVGQRLERVEADTGSGSVTILLPPDTGFRLTADVGSGRVRSRFSDAIAIVDDDDVVGYRRGDERVRIDADTGSGGVTVGPAH